MLAGCGEAAPVAVEVSEDVVPPLVEQLYAAEQGAAARARGDEVRLLVWLRALQPAAAQRAQLRQEATTIRTALDALQEDQARQDAAELAELAPIYDALLGVLSEETIDAERLSLQTEALAEATAESDHTAELALARTALEAATRFVRTLTEQQRPTMRQALFLLGADSPFVHALSGSWSDDDFASMRRVDRGAPTPGLLALSDLWTLDQGAVDLTAELTGARLQLLATLALGHPGLPAALDRLP